MDEVIKQQLKEVPDVLRKHIVSSALDETINEILKDQPLQNVQKEAFGLEVMLVLLQLSSVEEFTINIKHNMEIAMRRAEEISKKTKRLIFLPLQDYLIQRAFVEDEENENIAGDGVAAPQVKPQIHHETPKPVVEIESPSTSANTNISAKEQILKSPKIPEGDSLDIFKKRLQQSVHTPVEENKLVEGERKIANVDPSTKEDIAKDPYKESF